MIRQTLFRKIWIWLDLSLVMFTGLFLYYYCLEYPHSHLVALLILLYFTEVFQVFVTTARMKYDSNADNGSGHSGVL